MIYTQTQTPMVIPPKPAPKAFTHGKTFAQFAAMESAAMKRQQLGGGSEYTAQRHSIEFRHERNKANILTQLAAGPMMRGSLRVALGIGWVALKTAYNELEADGLITKGKRREIGAIRRECWFELVAA